jgi:hypothetical protein
VRRQKRVGEGNVAKRMKVMRRRGRKCVRGDTANREGVNLMGNE